MSDEPPQIESYIPGSPQFVAVMEAVKLMRQTAARMALHDIDMETGVMVMMTAAAMFAGEQGGMLLSVGAVPDRQRLIDCAAANFRQGLEVGLKHGLEIVAQVIAERSN